MNVFRESISACRLWACAILLGLSVGGNTSHAYVELVQLSASNIEEHVTGGARKYLVPGDVILRNESVQVAVLTSSTPSDPLRAGRCVPLTGASMMSDGVLASIQPGPHVAWVRPEAGQNDDLAVVKFRHDGNGWRAELTIRIRSAASGVEIATRLFNRDDEKTLQIPVVDVVRKSAGVNLAGLDERTIKMAGGESARAAAYFPLSPAVHLENKTDNWNVGLVSNDPAPGILKRVSRRILSFGRNNQTFEPLDAEREWDRSIRDHQSWFRIEAGQQRNIERRLVMSLSEAELPALVQLARQGSGASNPAKDAATPEAGGAVTVEAPNALSVPNGEGVNASVMLGDPSQPLPAPKKAPSVPSRIIGKLRVTESEHPPSSAPAPPTPAGSPPLPALPEPVEQAVPAEPTSDVDDDVAIPEIDAIEDLPAPE